MNVWQITHDCKKCNKPHSVCICEEEKPDDDAVYAYTCPEKDEEVKFRWKDMAWHPPQKKAPENAIKAYLSKA